MFSRRGTGPAAAFLHRLTENHDISDTEFLVDVAGYLIALFRRGSSGHLDYSSRNHIEERFQTGSTRFVHHYNFDHPNRSLDNHTSVAELRN